MTPNSRSYLNRWVQPDSIIPDPYNPQDYDRYSYVRNNPINFNDPTGHDQDCASMDTECKNRVKKEKEPPPPPPPAPSKVDDSILFSYLYHVSLQVGPGSNSQNRIDIYSDNPNDPNLLQYIQGGGEKPPVGAYGIAGIDALTRLGSLVPPVLTESKDNTWINFDATYKQNRAITISEINISTTYPDAAFLRVDLENGKEKYSNPFNNPYPLTNAWGASTKINITPNNFDGTKGLIITFYFECYSCISGSHAYYSTAVTLPAFVPK